MYYQLEYCIMCIVHTMKAVLNDLNSIIDRRLSRITVNHTQIGILYGCHIRMKRGGAPIVGGRSRWYLKCGRTVIPGKYNMHSSGRRQLRSQVNNKQDPK